MNLRTGLSLPLLAALAACTTVPAPDQPVPAGDGYVWVLKDGGRTAFWGPPASEPVFTVGCDAANGRVEFHHYGLAAPAEATGLRIEAGGESATWPVQVQHLDLGDRLLATTPVTDPFLQHMRQADQWRVHAGGQTLLVGASAAPPRVVLRDCGG